MLCCFAFWKHLSRNLDACHQGEADEGEEDGAADVHVCWGHVLWYDFCREAALGGFGKGCEFRELRCHYGFSVAPRPYFHEGSDDEAGKDDEGFFVPAGEEPVEEFREAEDSDYCTYEEYAEDEEVAGKVSAEEACDDSHDVFVFAENQEDEAAWDAWEDHSADGDGSAEEDEPQRIRGLGRGERAYCHA